MCICSKHFAGGKWRISNARTTSRVQAFVILNFFTLICKSPIYIYIVGKRSDDPKSSSYSPSIFGQDWDADISPLYCLYNDACLQWIKQTNVTWRLEQTTHAMHNILLSLKLLSSYNVQRWLLGFLHCFSWMTSWAEPFSWWNCWHLIGQFLLSQPTMSPPVDSWQ